MAVPVGDGIMTEAMLPNLTPITKCIVEVCASEDFNKACIAQKCRITAVNLIESPRIKGIFDRKCNLGGPIILKSSLC